MIDFLKILKTLSESQVDFVLVGALSAALQGAQVATFDVDIVHDRSSDNVQRLQNALSAMNARFRGHDHLVPTIDHLSTTGHQLLMTDFGPLDVLGAIEEGLEYADLMESAEPISIEDVAVHVLALSEYLRIRRAHPRPRDRARFALLEAALEEE